MEPATPLDYDRINEAEFRSRVMRALVEARIVLDAARLPHYLADAPHHFEDGYLLVAALTNVMLTAQLKFLELMGLTEKQLVTIKEWAQR